MLCEVNIVESGKGREGGRTGAFIRGNLGSKVGRVSSVIYWKFKELSGTALAALISHSLFLNCLVSFLEFHFVKFGRDIGGIINICWFYRVALRITLVRFFSFASFEILVL